jgi:prevent-host-death family protein
MQRISAREAKNNFGRLIDIARAEPVAVEKHGRAVVVVLSIEEFERLTAKKGGQSSTESERHRPPKAKP